MPQDVYSWFESSPGTIGPPTPIEAETGAMPADDGVWVHYNERFGPAGPELLQQGLEY